jgi:hypothetical protein
MRSQAAADAALFKDDKREALYGLLRSWGHDARDFEVDEDTDSELGRLFGLTGGVLTVRRRSTGEERLYATGMGSAWFAAVLMDLSRGLLGGRVMPRQAAARALL